MLFGLAVHGRASPTTRDPDGQVQPSLGVDPSQYGFAPEVFEHDPELFGQLPPERVLRILARMDVTTGEVPHVREPQPERRPVAEQDVALLSQDCGDNLMVLHWPIVLDQPGVVGSSAIGYDSKSRSRDRWPPGSPARQCQPELIGAGGLGSGGGTPAIPGRLANMGHPRIGQIGSGPER